MSAPALAASAAAAAASLAECEVGLTLAPMDAGDDDAGWGDEAALPRRTMGTVLCCLCGVAIAPNAANMCVNCLRGQVDLTDGLSKQVVLHQCRGCARFLRPPWVACALESKELLAICLKKVPGLNKVKLVDAGFIWTEPHSKRIKVKLTIQKDVLNGVKLQQVFAVEFLVQNQQCDACQRSFTDHTWRASVQVRQRVEHKKTFYLLEQLILRHGLHEKCINVEQVPAGIDFFFSERSHALKFIDFLGAVVPTRHKAAKQLISEDVHTSTRNYKFAYNVDIVPLCKDDVCVLPARLAAQLGNINPLVIVYRVSSVIFFLDPRSLQLAELSAERFWADQFRPLVSAAALEEFIVLDIVPVTIAPLQAAALRRKQLGGGGGKGRRMRLAAADAARERGGGGGSSANSVSGSKRKGGDGGDDEDDKASTFAAGSVAGFSKGGGFTGAVSLTGGSIAFNGAMSVASTVTGGKGGKLLLADAEVMRSRDLGVSDERFIVRTHMGNILTAGDRVLGYDLTKAVFNDLDAESTAVGGKTARKGAVGRSKGFDFPDIALVRKVFIRSRKDEARDMDRDLAAGERDSALAAGLSVAAAGIVSSGGGAAARAAAAAAAARGGDDDMGEGATSRRSAATAAAAAAAGGAARRKNKERVWKLKRLSDVVPTVHSDVGLRRGDEDKAASDFEAFMGDIERDPTLRKAINLYKNPSGIAARAAAASAAPPRSRSAAGGGGGGGGGAAAAPSARAAAAAARAAVAAADADEDEDGDEDEEDDDDEEEDGVDEGDIGLEELLDDLDVGHSSKGGGGVASKVREEGAGGGGSAAAAVGGAWEAVSPGDEGAPAAAGAPLPTVAEGDDDDDL